MHAQVEKLKENQSRALAKAVTQKNIDVKQGFGLVDNRPVAATQRKLQEIIAHRNSHTQAIQCKTTIKHKTGNFIYLSPLDETSPKQQVVGVEMHAFLDVNDPKNGTSPGGDQEEMMSRLRQVYKQTPMVKGHLLNGGLGGLGIAENLFPISVAANNDHKVEVENHVKSKMKEGCNVDYTVKVKNATLDESDARAIFHCTAKASDGAELDKEIRSDLQPPNSASEVWTTMDKTDDMYDSVGFNNKDLPLGWGQRGSGLRGELKRNYSGNIVENNGGNLHAKVN